MRCGFPSRSVPSVTVGKLYAKNGGLHRVEAPVPCEEDMVVLGPLAIVAHHADFLSQGRVIGGERTRVPVGPKVLARVKAEGAECSHRPADPTFVASSVRLARILDHRQVVTLGDIENRI